LKNGFREEKEREVEEKVGMGKRFRQEDKPLGFEKRVL
jgi:hypothetical protein